MKIVDIKRFALPDVPGVYFFLGARKKILYIGRATSLRDRVRSYFAKDLMDTRGPKLVKMLTEARSLDFRETDSVLEAMLLEGDLIRKFKPEYNTDDKDDKSYNCVVITDEEFPRVLLVRKKEIEAGLPDDLSSKFIAGPFPEGGKFQTALKIIRRIFPYRDSKCTPNQGRPCFNRQIGLCPGVCTGEISKQGYAQTIKHIQRLFEGKKSFIIRDLKRDMQRYAKTQEFEKAEQAKRTIFSLEHIQDVALIAEHPTGSEIVQRIEAFDVAHTAGKETVAVMTVVSGSKPDKSAYRMFRIKEDSAGDDLKALAEVLRRRFNHREWGMPDVIAVDGGVTQLNLAQQILAQAGITARLVSVVKDEHHRPSRILGDRDAAARLRTPILLANREAHRFAISFHRRRRDKLTK